MSGPASEPSSTHAPQAAESEPYGSPGVNVSLLAQVDFAARGLFWDRPGMSNERFLGVLADPEHPQHRWAWTRVLERLPSRVVTRSLSLRDLQQLIRIVRLRPPLQRAWQSAIEFWTEDSRSRTS